MILDEEKAMVYDYLSGYGLNDMKCLRSAGGNSLSISTTLLSTLTILHFSNLESNKMAKLEFDKQQLIDLIRELKGICEIMKFIDD